MAATPVTLEHVVVVGQWRDESCGHRRWHRLPEGITAHAAAGEAAARADGDGGRQAVARGGDGKRCGSGRSMSRSRRR